MSMTGHNNHLLPRIFTKQSQYIQINVRQHIYIYIHILHIRKWNITAGGLLFALEYILKDECKYH